MSLRRTLVACGVVVIAALLLAAAPQPTEEWKSVREAMARGLPKTAIKKLEPIVRRALDEKRYAEAIKAIGIRTVLESNIQGNKPEEKITRMQAEIQQAPDEMKPVMETILAHWYWHYFQQNRWRFMQRTQTSAPPGDDFTTWDVPQILAEIDRQFQKSLESQEALKNIPVADYDDLLEKGNVPDT
ncbi:MAG: hypothetical protein MI861_21430, partial [Pirellulales bacterium]|nr:hypothetical protein [Pirellulales bacterium]